MLPGPHGVGGQGMTLNTSSSAERISLVQKAMEKERERERERKRKREREVEKDREREVEWTWEEIVTHAHLAFY